MKTIIKALGFVGLGMIIFATGYFIQLYVDFTQLILSLGIAGFLILASFLYIYNWIKNNDEIYVIEKEKRKKELEELNKSIDLTRDYVRDLEERYS